MTFQNTLFDLFTGEFEAQAHASSTRKVLR
jgi:hypothetical protein